MFVVDVTANSGAAKAGLKPGDVITTIDGRPIASADEVAAVIRTKKPGDTIDVTFQRMGTEDTATVTLGRRG